MTRSLGFRRWFTSLLWTIGLATSTFATLLAQTPLSTDQDRLEQDRDAGVFVGPVVFVVNAAYDDTDVDIGLRALGGFNWALKNSREAFVEVSLGIGYVNDIQVMAGWLNNYRC